MSQNIYPCDNGIDFDVDYVDNKIYGRVIAASRINLCYKLTDIETRKAEAPCTLNITAASENPKAFLK